MDDMINEYDWITEDNIESNTRLVTNDLKEWSSEVC